MVSESGQRSEPTPQAEAPTVAPPARDEPPEVDVPPGPKVEPQIIEPTEPERPAKVEPTAEAPEPSGQRAPDVAVDGAPARPAPVAPKPSPPDDANKPPSVIPNTYWTRKGGGWVLEFKRKVKHRWQYEYFGLLDLETWNQLKGRYEQERLVNIIRGIILARRAQRERPERAGTGNHRLRLVGKGR